MKETTHMENWKTGDVFEFEETFYELIGYDSLNDCFAYRIHGDTCLSSYIYRCQLRGLRKLDDAEKIKLILSL